MLDREGIIMQYKQLKLVTNYKTDKQSVEYRIFNDDGSFKTIAPTKWLNMRMEDRTTEEDIRKINIYFCKEFNKNNFREIMDLNIAIHQEGADVEQLTKDYIKRNGIKQFVKGDLDMTMMMRF